MSASAFWIIWLSLTPIIDRDATRFHLPFAKLWAENGFLYFRQYFAYYDLNMLNLDYLYMLVFKFGLSDQFTKIIHASFLLAGGYLIFKYFKDKYSFNWGALSFILYITIPVHQRLASEVYVDLGLLFFSTLSIIYLIKWFESDFSKKKYFYISAIGTGLAFGTKYNAMIFAFFITLIIALMIAREKKDDKLALRSMSAYTLIIVLCASPWLIRNFINSDNPFFPLFDSIIPSDINMPAELVEGGFGEIMNRIINGGESIFSLFFLPVRVFFQGADHDFLKFDGVLNPLMILLIPFLFLKQNSVKIEKKKLINYLLSLFAVVYFTTLYVNDIRIRYFIPVYPILIILNIESLKILFLKNSKTKYAAFILVLVYFAININYGLDIYKTYDMSNYNPFRLASKQKYLERYLRNYEIIQFINENTPEQSVIYEAFTGGRSYYIDRTFYCDTNPLDRYLIELAKKGADMKDYIKHFKNLPNSNLSATHLMIRPNDFIKTFIDLTRAEDDPDDLISKSKLKGFLEFINNLKLLKEKNGVFLYSMIY
jgi:hypothetical protein